MMTKLEYKRLIKKLYQEISKQDSLIAKLEYLINNQSVYSTYVMEYEKDFRSVRAIPIPKIIYDNHFPDLENNTEYKYWFFNYKSNLIFETMINSKVFKRKSNSKIALDFLNAELIAIQNFEKRVSELILKGDINIEEKTHAVHKEFEYIRVIDDYYKSNLWDGNNDATLCKAKYILFKSYLENKIQEIEKHNTSVNGISKIMQLKSNSKDKIDFKKLHKELTSDRPYFDKETDEESFLFAFGEINEIADYKPLLWVKKQETEFKNNVIAKAAFLDLLELLNINYEDSEIRKSIKQLFLKPDGNPMDITNANLKKNTENYKRNNSKIHYENLKMIIHKCKLT